MRDWLADPSADTLETLDEQSKRWGDAGAFDISARARIPPFEAIELDSSGVFPPQPLTVVVHGDPHGLIPMATAEEERSADPGWVAAQRAFAARSNRSRFVIAARSGHLIVNERPDLVIAEVEAMLVELRRSP